MKGFRDKKLQLNIVANIKYDNYIREHEFDIQDTDFAKIWCIIETWKPKFGLTRRVIEHTHLFYGLKSVYLSWRKSKDKYLDLEMTKVDRHHFCVTYKRRDGDFVKLHYITEEYGKNLGILV